LTRFPEVAPGIERIVSDDPGQLVVEEQVLEFGG
jgi:hypothetical protein